MTYEESIAKTKAEWSTKQKRDWLLSILGEWESLTTKVVVDQRNNGEIFWRWSGERKILGRGVDVCFNALYDITSSERMYPYHQTRSFTPLLSIIDLPSTDFQWFINWCENRI